MMIDIREFGGLIPRMDDKALPSNAAQTAGNVKLWNNILAALHEPVLTSALTKTGTILTVYRVNYASTDYWMHWALDIDVVRWPTSGDATELFIYTGEGEPRVTHAEMVSAKTDTIGGSDIYPSGYGESVSTDYPRAFYALGVPRPLNAPTLGTPTGGSGTDEARAYVYTFVNAWGEESAPSPASGIQTGKPDGTWPLSAMDTAPINTGSISGASHSAGLVTVTTTADHWLRKGHKITIDSVTGMTDLNDDFTVYDVPSDTTFRVELTTAQSYTSGGTWTRQAPYNVDSMQRRIYRTLTGFDGQAYKYVDEISAATTTYNDTKEADELGETLPTVDIDIAGSDWEMPPGDLIGIVSLGSFLCGFRQGTNELYFSVPGAPYAWPEAYRQTIDWPIVGLGAWGSTVTIATTATPYRASGFHPEAMNIGGTDRRFPCVAKRSIVSSDKFGVMFATDRGLCADFSGGTELVTERYYDRDAWQDGVDGDNLFAMEHDGRYLGFWSVESATGNAIMFDPGHLNGAISNVGLEITGTYTDPETGLSYIIDSDGVKQWDDESGEKMTYEWRSKTYVLPFAGVFKAAKVVSEYTLSAAEVEAIEALNVTRTATNAALIATIPTGATKVDPLNGAVSGFTVAGQDVAGDDLLAMLSTGAQSVVFEIYGDGSLVYSTTVNAITPFRLEGNTKYSEVSVRLSGTVNVHSVQFAETKSELAQL